VQAGAHRDVVGDEVGGDGNEVGVEGHEVGVEGDVVGVEGCDESQGQSHTAQQVCSIIYLLLPVTRCIHSVYKQVCQ